MVCAKHPRYKGARKPRAACETCWCIYLGISEYCMNCGCEQTMQELMNKMVGR